MGANRAMREQIRILYVEPTSLIGGAENSLQLLIKHLDRDAFHPMAVVPDRGPLFHRLTGLGVEVVASPLHPLKTRNPLPYCMTVARLAILVRDRRADLVHCNLEWAHQYALPAARLNRVPIVCHTRFSFLSKRAFQRLFLAYADALIPISQFVHANYAAYTRSSQRVVVVKNGVDLSEFSPSPERRKRERRRLGITDDRFVVGVAGRLEQEKGQHTLIRALAEIAEVNANVHGLVVGDTKIDSSERYLDELKWLAGELGVSHRVQFTGFVDDMASLYDCVDAVAVPSVGDSFGRTFIEGMAMEKPVVATGVGATVEAIQDGLHALLVPPDDPGELARAILKLANDREFSTAIARRGRALVERCFSGPKHAGEIQQVYLDLLRRSKAN